MNKKCLNRQNAEDINIELAHKGMYLSTYNLFYTFPNRVKKYEIVSRQGTFKNPDVIKSVSELAQKVSGVTLFVYNKEHSKILLAKEFRLSVNKFIINTVSGLIDAGETIENAARRELFEETGLKISKILNVLSGSITAPSISDDIVSLVICEAEGDIVNSRVYDEEIYAEWYSKEDIRQMLVSNEILMSGRTQALAFAWAFSI